MIATVAWNRDPQGNPVGLVKAEEKQHRYRPCAPALSRTVVKDAQRSAGRPDQIGGPGPGSRLRALATRYD